jgi:hypothetical protein
MNNHKVSAQTLISWQRKTEKCEKPDFLKLEVHLDIAQAPEGMAQRESYGCSLRV